MKFDEWLDEKLKDPVFEEAYEMVAEEDRMNEPEAYNMVWNVVLWHVSLSWYDSSMWAIHYPKHLKYLALHLGRLTIFFWR